MRTVTVGSALWVIAKLFVLGFGMLLLLGGGICGVSFLFQGGGFVLGVLELLLAFWGLTIVIGAGASLKARYFSKPMNNKRDDKNL